MGESKPADICEPTSFSMILFTHGRMVIGRYFSLAGLSSFLYTAVQSPLFQSLGHILFVIHELNRVVSGLDNSSAPIFKTLGRIPSLPVAFMMFNDSSTARTCPWVTGLTLMVCFPLSVSCWICWTLGWSLKSSIMSCTQPHHLQFRPLTLQNALPVLPQLVFDP